jgi:hypothetical protein
LRKKRADNKVQLKDTASKKAPANLHRRCRGRERHRDVRLVSHPDRPRTQSPAFSLDAPSRPSHPHRFETQPTSTPLWS